MQPHGRPLDDFPTPDQWIHHWPVDRRLLMLHSGRSESRWARWSILGEPGLPGEPGEPGGGRFSPSSSTPPTGDPLAQLQQAMDGEPDGIWIGYFSYDLGRWIEQLPQQARADRHWPVIEFAHCPGYLLHDHLHRQTYACGTWENQTDLPMMSLGASQASAPSEPHEVQIAPPTSLFDQAAYEQAVQQCIDYIHAGDVFQVNLAQRFTSAMHGPYPQTSRQLFEQLADVSPAWYGAYLELTDQRAIASTSPELFLDVSPSGHITTRPIKGTAPASRPAEHLAKSEKDQAELHMIVDLMRNDLGRVCQFGSITVTEPRVIETHPTIHHGVATIEGQLAPDKNIFDLLRATLPGGSVTGAPKVRAMQIIDELEPVRRGPYCGAIGYLSHKHGNCLNIAIRTILVEPQHIDYSVGGGIVADSNPTDEYHETLHKAAAMEQAIRQLNQTSMTTTEPPSAPAQKHHKPHC